MVDRIDPSGTHHHEHNTDDIGNEHCLNNWAYHDYDCGNYFYHGHSFCPLIDHNYYLEGNFCMDYDRILNYPGNYCFDNHHFDIGLGMCSDFFDLYHENFDL